jgi:hypothetical protein
MKNLSLFCFFLFLFSLSFASGIKVYPYQINFELQQGQTVCKNLSVESYESLVLTDRWAESWEVNKTLSLHKLSSQEVGIELTTEIISTDSDKNILSVCVFSQEVGKHHGVLLIREESKKSGVGVWMNVSIIKGNFGQSFITGSSIKNIEKTNPKVFFYLTTTLLLSIFVFCLIKIKKSQLSS